MEETLRTKGGDLRATWLDVTCLKINNRAVEVSARRPLAHIGADRLARQIVRALTAPPSCFLHQPEGIMLKIEHARASGKNDRDATSIFGPNHVEFNANVAANVRWTVLLPFFNEQNCVSETIASLAAQNRGVVIILIDNGSTDDSVAVAKARCQKFGLRFHLVTEQNPGKVAALASGMHHVRTEFIATCDADTWYPPDYFAKAEALLADGDVAAVGAYFVARDASAATHRLESWHIAAAGFLLPDQCHTGGAGQAFRTTMLKSAGGFDPQVWDWILEDHEVMHRVAKLGRIAYGKSFWCAPSPRLRERPSVRWTLLERLLYHLSSSRQREWFFYSFLSRRLQVRNLPSKALRELSCKQTLEYGRCPA